MSSGESKQKPRLGKGLSLLLGSMGQTFEDGSVGNVSDKESSFVEKPAFDIVSEIEVDKINPNPNQPRRKFEEDKLLELAESIKQYGLLQPVIVSKNTEDENYIIVAGERRYRACKLLNMEKISCIVKSNLSDKKDVITAAITENIQRVDLNPIEEAMCYEYLQITFDYSHADIAKMIGKSRSYVSNAVRLSKLSPDVKGLVSDGKISFGHAKVLLSIDDESILSDVAQLCVDQSFSVRELEDFIKQNITKADIAAPDSLIIQPTFSEPNVFSSNKLGDMTKEIPLNDRFEQWKEQITLTNKNIELNEVKVDDKDEIDLVVDENEDMDEDFDDEEDVDLDQEAIEEDFEDPEDIASKIDKDDNQYHLTAPPTNQIGSRFSQRHSTSLAGRNSYSPQSPLPPTFQEDDGDDSDDGDDEQTQTPEEMINSLIEVFNSSFDSKLIINQGPKGPVISINVVSQEEMLKIMLRLGGYGDYDPYGESDEDEEEDD